MSWKIHWQNLTEIHSRRINMSPRDSWSDELFLIYQKYFAVHILRKNQESIFLLTHLLSRLLKDKRILFYKFKRWYLVLCRVLVRTACARAQGSDIHFECRSRTVVRKSCAKYIRRRCSNLVLFKSFCCNIRLKNLHSKKKKIIEILKIR